MPHLCCNCAEKFDVGTTVYVEGILVAAVCPVCTKDVYSAKIVLKDNGVRLAYDQYSVLEMKDPSFGVRDEPKSVVSAR